MYPWKRVASLSLVLALSMAIVVYISISTDWGLIITVSIGPENAWMHFFLTFCWNPQSLLVHCVSENYRCMLRADSLEETMPKLPLMSRQITSQAFLEVGPLKEQRLKRGWKKKNKAPVCIVRNVIHYLTLQDVNKQKYEHVNAHNRRIEFVFVIFSCY